MCIRDSYYQWQVNGTNLDQARYASLEFTPALPRHSGAYSAVVSNDFGSATNAFVLTVEGSAPEFTQQPTNQIALLGQTIRCFANATGAPPPQFQWQFNGSEIPGATSPLLQ